MVMLNPNYLPHLDLVADTPTWDALKLVVTDWLDANASGATLSAADITTIRALDAQLANDAIWAQITADLGISGVP